MAFNFPNAPADGDTFTPPGGPTYRFVTPKWTVLGSSASVEISDTAPSNPSPGNLWWEADTGKLFVWYADGTSSQWVEAAGGGRGPAAAGWRNRIINGDFSINQRAVTAVPAATATYVADRWLGISNQAPGAITANNSAMTGQRPGEFLMAISPSVADATLAATDVYAFGQRIEGFFCKDFNWGVAVANPITVSFLVYGTSAMTLALSIRNATAARSWLGSFNVPTDWVRVVMTVPGDTTGTWEVGNSFGLELRIGLGVGSTYQGVPGWQAGNFQTLPGMTNFMASTSNALYLRDFQVEIGTQATEFERVPYDQQLMRCQRYYETDGGGGLGLFFSANVTTANDYITSAEFKVTKRGNPTLTLVNNLGSNFPAASGISGSSVGKLYEQRTANSTGPGRYQSTWTASAEL